MRWQLSVLVRPAMWLMIAAGWSLTSFAQGSYTPEHWDYAVTPFLGASFLSNYEFTTPVVGETAPTTRTVGFHYGNGYQIGLRIVDNLDDYYWTSELEYSFANQPLTITNLSPDIPSFSAGQSIQHLSYNVSFLPLSPSRRFRPYATIGAGASLFHIAKRSKEEANAIGLGLNSDWQFSLNWGGGLKYMADNQVALVFDVRDHLSRFPSYGLPQSTVVAGGRFRPGFASSGLIQNWQINLGVAIQWNDF